MVVIVLLNLLIAIMGDSYEKVKEKEAVHALHERAKMIMEMELQHPSWHTFCDFMHVIEAADEDSKPTPEWEGITGRVKQLLEATNARVDSSNAKVDGARREIACVREEMKATRDEVRQLRELMQQLLNKKT